MRFRATTTEDEGHSHTAVVNEYGDGSTSAGPADGHRHDIRSWQVQPGGADGHTHGLYMDLRPEAA